MPIYEYKCTKCKNHFEAMQKFSDDPISQCPACGGPAKKLMSRSSFHLKGSGWYLTDYAKRGSASDTGTKSETAAPSTDSSSSSSDDSD